MSKQLNVNFFLITIHDLKATSNKQDVRIDTSAKLKKIYFHLPLSSTVFLDFPMKSLEILQRRLPKLAQL
jgi:hypothetical protein